MQDHGPQPQALDPIALSLAVWLGLMVGAMGLQHLSALAALREASLHGSAISPAPSMLAFGS